jgi:hypothetical protein
MSVLMLFCLTLVPAAPSPHQEAVDLVGVLRDDFRGAFGSVEPAPDPAPVLTPAQGALRFAAAGALVQAEISLTAEQREHAREKFRAFLDDLRAAPASDLAHVLPRVNRALERIHASGSTTSPRVCSGSRSRCSPCRSPASCA